MWGRLQRAETVLRAGKQSGKHARTFRPLSRPLPFTPSGRAAPRYAQ